MSVWWSGSAGTRSGAFAHVLLVALLLALPQAARAADQYIVRELPGGAMADMHTGPGVNFPRNGRLPAGTRLKSHRCVRAVFEIWCEVEVTEGPRLRGFVLERQLAAVSPPGGGPDYFVVAGLGRGDRLNIRTQPTPEARVLTTVAEGTRLRNLGCEQSAGRRWCRVQLTDGSALNGWANARYLREATAPPPPPPEDPGGGPDYYVVAGLSSGDRLNIRERPSAEARILGTLAQGDTVRNLGCESVGGTRWCRIRTTRGADITGWVRGRYLREGSPPPPEDPGAGPDTLVVRGLPAGDRLNLRERPSTSARILTSLGEGERVVNLGCERHGQTRWCRVRTVTGVTGWASARYLREG